MKNPSLVVGLTLTILVMILGFQNCGKKDSQVGTLSSSSSGNGSSVTTTTVPNRQASKIVLQDYRQTTSGKYFMTGKTSDKQAVESSGLFQKKGTITVFQSPDSTTSALCRFWSSKTRSHFYTARKDACDALRDNADFTYEDIEGYVVLPTAGACPGGLFPVYQLFSPLSFPDLDRTHRFTPSAEIRSQLITQGWNDEGVSFCAAQVEIVK